MLSRGSASGELRAQVADFGLARRDDEASAEEVPTEEEEVMLTRSSMFDHGLTRIGAVVGTPMYMSPEQHVGSPVDARTDQFSFCVALFEALYGVRPFDGATIEALALAATLTKRRAPPVGSAVPGWLHRICLRGLQPDREARFPGMDALLTEISRGRARGRNRWLFAGAVAVVAAVASAVWVMRGESPPQLCASGSERMAGVWDAEVRAQAEQAFLATDKAYAGDMWTAASAEVDHYGAAWLAMHRDSCEATQVRGEQSAELMDLRSSCLAGRLQELRALTGLYAKADATVVKQAVNAAEALPRLEACADAAALRESQATPPAEQAEAVEAVRGRLAEARMLREAGKPKDALEIGKAALVAAEGLGFAPLLAQAQQNVGTAQEDAGEHEAAVATLTTAAAAKLAVRDDDGLLSAMLSLAGTLGYHLGRDKEAAPWLALAGAIVKRRGEAPEDVSRLLLVSASVAITAQRYAEAEELLRRGVRLVADDATDGLALARFRNALGGVYLRTGKYAEAQAEFEQAVALDRGVLGPSHPSIASPLNNLALTYERQARYADAVATLRTAMELIARTSGADHPNVGLLRQNLGGMLRLAGNFKEARAELDAGIGILEAKLGREHPALGHAWTLSGDLARDMGDWTRARVDLQNADELRRKVLGEEHPDRSLSLLGLGRLALVEGKRDEAARYLEKALELMADQPDPIDQAEARFYLAYALPTSERVRARALADQARAAFVAAGVLGLRHVPEVDEWLAGHP